MPQNSTSWERRAERHNQVGAGNSRLLVNGLFRRQHDNDDCQLTPREFSGGSEQGAYRNLSRSSTIDN